MKLNPDWSSTLALLGELWPNNDITEGQLDVWHKAIGNENQLRVQEAMRMVFGKYTSPTPKLPWIRQTIDWMKSEQVRDRVDDPDSKRKAEAAMEREVAESDQTALHSLMRTPDSLVAAAREVVEGFIGEPNSDDMTKWGAFRRGLVWAQVQRIESGEAIDREAIAARIQQGDSMTSVCERFGVKPLPVISACARHDVQFSGEDEPFNLVIDSLPVTRRGRVLMAKGAR